MVTGPVIEISQGAWTMGIFALFALAASVITTVVAVVAGGSSDDEVSHQTKKLFLATSDAKWGGLGIAALALACAVLMGFYAASGVHIS